MKKAILYVKNFGICMLIVKIIAKFCEGKNSNFLKAFIVYKHKKVEKKLKKYISKNDLDVQNNTGKNDSKIIWIFWYQGMSNAPEIINFCINSVRKHCSEYNIIILDKNNFRKYYEPSEKIMEKFNKGEITITHFSDILRMNLLNKYGGRWMDATIFLTGNPFKTNEFYTLRTKEECIDIVSNNRWTGFFIGGDNPILYRFASNFFDMYWDKNDCLIDYFLVDYVIDMAYNIFEDVKNKIDGIEFNNEDYLFFQENINNTIDEKCIESIICNTCVHKLSYKIPICHSIDTIYNKVIRMEK